MGELRVPNRFIDIFQGRAPRSVLAKHYTRKRLLRLKRSYDKTNLKILKEEKLKIRTVEDKQE